MKKREEFNKALAALRHYVVQRSNFNIAEAFEADATRFERFSLQIQDLLFDFSKTALDMKLLTLLENLGKAAVTLLFNVFQIAKQHDINLPKI